MNQPIRLLLLIAAMLAGFKAAATGSWGILSASTALVFFWCYAMFTAAGEHAEE